MGKRLYALCLFISMGISNVFAEYDGRWYSVEDHQSSSSSGFGSVIMFVIGAICAFFLIGSIIKDKDRANDEKGCLTIFFVAILIIAFLCLLSQCK